MVAPKGGPVRHMVVAADVDKKPHFVQVAHLGGSAKQNVGSSTVNFHHAGALTKSSAMAASISTSHA